MQCGLCAGKDGGPCVRHVNSRYGCVRPENVNADEERIQRYEARQGIAQKQPRPTASGSKKKFNVPKQFREHIERRGIKSFDKKNKEVDLSKYVDHLFKRAHISCTFEGSENVERRTRKNKQASSSQTGSAIGRGRPSEKALVPQKKKKQAPPPRTGSVTGRSRPSENGIAGYDDLEDRPRAPQSGRPGRPRPRYESEATVIRRSREQPQVLMLPPPQNYVAQQQPQTITILPTASQEHPSTIQRQLARMNRPLPRSITVLPAEQPQTGTILPVASQEHPSTIQRQLARMNQPLPPSGPILVPAPERYAGIFDDISNMSDSDSDDENSEGESE